MSGRLRALPLSLPRIERSPRGPLGGVCSGIAEAAAVDPTIVRLAFAFFTLVGGAGVAAYGAAWLALPVAGQGPVSARRRVLGIAALAAAVLLALHGLGLSGALLSTTSGGRSQPLAPAALIAAIALVF